MADVAYVKVRSVSTGEERFISPDEAIPPGFEPVFESTVSEPAKVESSFGFILGLAIGF